ncbi:MAG: SH3 domain-containing protein [Devosia sp.]
MPLPRLTLIAATAVAVLGFAGAAQAATAYASSTVNVRSGAGTGYAVVDVLRPGQRVEVDYCRGSWCYVEKSGPDGWVSARYLDADRYRDDDWYDEDDYYDDGFYLERPRPFPFFRSQVCWGGNRASFCFSD